MTSRFWTAYIVMAALAAPVALAISYSSLSPEQVTAASDVWIRGRVATVSGPEIETNGFGDTFYNVTLGLVVHEATDDTPQGIIIVRSKTSFRYKLREGKDVFAAFVREGDEYSVFHQLGLYGWTEIDPETETVLTDYGPIDADEYWHWLRCIRRAVDGQPTDADRARWTAALDLTSIPHVGLAIDYFRLPTVGHPDPLACFSAFIRVYDQLYAAKPMGFEKRDRSKSHLSYLAIAATREAHEQGVDKTGAMLMDFIEQDAAELRIVRDSGWGVSEYLLRALRELTDPVQIARTPRVYTHVGDLGLSEFELFPIAPSAELDAWLWRIVRDPERLGIRQPTALVGVWRALAKRGNEEFGNYLSAMMDGADMPVLSHSQYDPVRMKRAASEALEIFDRTSLSHEERMKAWVLRIRKGDLRLLSRFAMEVLPSDKYVIPELASLSEEHWRSAEFANHIWPATTIMRLLPDPSFLPLLRKWSPEPVRTEEMVGLLEALAVCGGESDAIERAVDILEQPIPENSLYLSATAMELRANLILFLGSFGDPQFMQHVRPYLETDRLASLQRTFESFDELPGGQSPLPVWHIRDAALLAITRSGATDRMSYLQNAFESKDSRARFVAAIALYATDDDRGFDLIRAFQERRELNVVPREDQQWTIMHGGSFYDAAIVYLQNARLDDVYFNRMRVTPIHPDDFKVARDRDLFARNRTQLLELLHQQLDPQKLQLCDEAVETLQVQTGEYFGFNPDASMGFQETSVGAWKAYIDAELERTAN